MAFLRFKIRLYRHYKYEDSIAGIITETNQMFFFAQDLARFLKPKKPQQWTSKMADHFLVNVHRDPLLKKHPMMDSRTLMDTLKQKPNLGRHYYLLRIIEGTDHVHYKGMHLKEHLLDACPCAATDGVSFVEWAEKEKRKMDADLEIERNVRHKHILEWMQETPCDTTCPEDFMEPATLKAPTDFTATLKAPTDSPGTASSSKAPTDSPGTASTSKETTDSPGTASTMKAPTDFMHDFLDSPNAEFLKGPTDLRDILEAPQDTTKKATDFGDSPTELQSFSALLKNVITDF